MSHRVMMLLLSGAIGISVTGCATTTPVTRAQSPSAQPVGWHQPVHGSSCQQCQGGYGCPSCQNPNELCNLPCHPVHRNAFTYDVPGKGPMMYPPSPSQAAVVQYPYYTFRGPTDFFMK